MGFAEQLMFLYGRFNISKVSETNDICSHSPNLKFGKPTQNCFLLRSTDIPTAENTIL